MVVPMYKETIPDKGWDPVTSDAQSSLTFRVKKGEIPETLLDYFSDALFANHGKRPNIDCSNGVPSTDTVYIEKGVISILIQYAKLDVS